LSDCEKAQVRKLDWVLAYWYAGGW